MHKEMFYRPFCLKRKMFSHLKWFTSFSPGSSYSGMFFLRDMAIYDKGIIYLPVYKTKT